MILSFQVAALVPKCELDQLGVSTNQDLHSRMMTQALRKIHYTLSRSQTLIIFVNQVKATLPKIVFFSFECQFIQCTNEPLDLSFNTIFHIQIRFSPKAVKGGGSMEEVTCGGNALRFYAAIRLRLSKMGLIKNEDKVSS